jgi:Protein of unknown function (DUF1465)
MDAPAIATATNGAVMLHRNRLQAWAMSPSFPRMYEDVAGLCERLASYLDGPGRTDQAKLSSTGRWHYAASTMRATNRMLSLMKAYMGARDDNYPCGLLMHAPKRETKLESLPPAYVALLAELDALEARTWRLFQAPTPAAPHAKLSIVKAEEAP